MYVTIGSGLDSNVNSKSYSWLIKGPSPDITRFCCMRVTFGITFYNFCNIKLCSNCFFLNSDRSLIHQTLMEPIRIYTACIIRMLKLFYFYDRKHCRPSRNVTERSLFVWLVWLFTSRSTFFQLWRDGSSCFEPVLSRD